jgi:hypothetical protein
MADVEDFTDWLAIGLDKGWISDVSCFCHDQVPMTSEEEMDWEESGEVCIPVVRLWGPEGQSLQQGDVAQLRESRP